MSANEQGEPPLSDKPETNYPESFLLAFRAAAGSLGWQVRGWQGDRAVCVDPRGKPWGLGLENVYQRARRAGPDRWPGILADFLAHMASTGEASAAGLEDAAGRLMVRLGRPFAEEHAAKVWSSPLAGTPFVVYLVVDNERSMTFVGPEKVEQSGRPGAEWLARALDNLAARTPAGSIEVVDADSGVRLCNVNDGYDAARALVLDRLLPETRPLGCFVAVPKRDQLLVLPARRQAVPFLHLLKHLAEKGFEKAPYPISNDVFWAHEGAWSPVPVEFRDGTLSVGMPDDLGELLQLGGRGGQPAGNGGQE
jgi:hypothetical protein